MDTKEFLERVHAKSDHVVICTHKPDPTGKNARGIFWNRGSFAYDELDAAVASIQQWDAQGNTTIYYAVGAMAGHEYVDDNGKTKWYRTQEHATKFKTLCFDLDVGDNKYSSQKEAVTALLATLDELSIPYPMIVSSGNGLHCYWPLHTEIDKAKWVMLSEALCTALQAHGFTFDASKIKDPSMVLRPIGTHHKKQEPWKEVKIIYGADLIFDVADLSDILAEWVGKAKPKTAAPKSSVAAAILGPNNDVVLDKVIENCNQVNMLATSGGFVDAAGNQVEEPMWRASLGLAKYTTDPEEAVKRLAGDHPDFDLDANMKKLEGWKGTGPTTCATFEQHCPEGCIDCPYKGSITSPAQLSGKTTDVVDTQEGEERHIEMPDGYIIRDNSIYKEVEVESEQTLPDGSTQINKTVEFHIVSHYPMHVTGIFRNQETGESTFRLAVKHPMEGWSEEDHEVDVLSGGQAFAKFLHNRQIFDAKNIGQQEKARIYILDYLSKVQSMSPSGIDYVNFGWQKDGSFLCGNLVIGGVQDGVDRRLKGAAQRFDDVIVRSGTREGWVSAMKTLNKPEAKTLRMVMLIAMGSVLSRAAGNCTGLVSIYSHKTTTGKTLALYALNSMFGHPKELLLQHRDTANAMYKIRGVLNQLPCTIDELTTVNAERAVELTYDFSSGVEKNAMTQQRELRDPARWTGPTFITTNNSFVQQFDIAQTNDSALRARCLELVHDDRRLVEKDEDGVSPADLFVDELFEHHGWAYPELVKTVMELGGDKHLWKQLRPKFITKFGTVFRAVDKYAEPMLITGWIVGTIAKSLGLISFDIDRVVKDWIEHLHMAHDYTDSHTTDAIDIVGQYLQENNDQIIEATLRDGDVRESVKLPAPQTAVARILLKLDAKEDVQKGSYIAVNIPLIKKWLAQSRDGVDRLTRELEELGALISPKQRVSMFKGCQTGNPGQTHCFLVDLTHSRFLSELKSTNAIKNSTVIEAILGGANGSQENQQS